jgi:hypothetical protein
MRIAVTTKLGTRQAPSTTPSNRRIVGTLARRLASSWRKSKKPRTSCAGFSNLRIEPVTVAVAREAARIRAVTAAPTPDALILASAVAASAAIVGNDRSWPGITKQAGLSLAVVVLERA